VTTSDMMRGVVCFGECMIELSRAADGAAKVGFAGDTLNTAIYLSRLGVPTRYMTALGHDAWSEDMRHQWADEGIDTSLVLTHPTRAPGLYAISTDPAGERSFTYWRDQSAARAIFECQGVEEAMSSAAQTGLLYISGISLAILTPSDRRRITHLARSVRQAGGVVAFDPNYRARLWPSPEAFKAAILDLVPSISCALPSFDDEAAVWGDPSPEATLARWTGPDMGVSDVVVKHGAHGALTRDGWVVARTVDKPVDTTGAGDSFNAGYLARRLAGDSPVMAAQFGAELAAQVVCHPGAIMPKGESQPVVCKALRS
jgi:2-dehydro-3-deoxygluconokinase